MKTTPKFKIIEKCIWSFYDSMRNMNIKFRHISKSFAFTEEMLIDRKIHLYTDLRGNNQTVLNEEKQHDLIAMYFNTLSDFNLSL